MHTVVYYLKYLFIYYKNISMCMSQSETAAILTTIVAFNNIVYTSVKLTLSDPSGKCSDAISQQLQCKKSHDILRLKAQIRLHQVQKYEQLYH